MAEVMAYNVSVQECSSLVVAWKWTPVLYPKESISKLV